MLTGSQSFLNWQRNFPSSTPEPRIPNNNVAFVKIPVTKTVTTVDSLDKYYTGDGS